ncbi:hypothetical protein [Paenibacillus alkalitolerans]|uniref:hypothetical protein n=1 Tax=Paenibacillus alkalitolerans TaxID=2799335 RepID=UPI0018F54D25|nr:hypothetical protein [Paenibacillus alkalitolerans]
MPDRQPNDSKNGQSENFQNGPGGLDNMLSGVTDAVQDIILGDDPNNNNRKQQAKNQNQNQNQNQNNTQQQ